MTLSKSIEEAKVRIERMKTDILREDIPIGDKTRWIWGLDEGLNLVNQISSSLEKAKKEITEKGLCVPDWGTQAIPTIDVLKILGETEKEKGT